MSAKDFLERLLVYLKDAVPEIKTLATTIPNSCMYAWQEKTYCLKLAFSPLSLPAAGDAMTAEDCYLAVIGPFAAQKWEFLYPYCDYPEFRDHVACYDPWSLRKLNISKGGLFAYIDWFFRDSFQKKFLIEDTFKKAIHTLGLLRFDDEG